MPQGGRFPQLTPEWWPVAAGGVRRAAGRIFPNSALADKPPSGTLIAQDAERYIGLGYVFGGDASQPGVWDCSSFVSYVLGHDLGLALPGGRWGEPGFPPTAHGPVVTSYASWTGAVTVTTAEVGDLACFVGEGASGHIGIVVGNNLMVSALDTAQGTCKTPIIGYGPYGAPLIYRRILGIPPGPGIPGRGGGGGAGGGGPGSALVALMVVGAMAGAVVLAAGLVGALVAAGSVWLAGKAMS
jgi:cell wall-associated NlpC family hydrolase